jgi:hypothetical protein
MQNMVQSICLSFKGVKSGNSVVAIQEAGRAITTCTSIKTCQMSYNNLPQNEI